MKKATGTSVLLLLLFSWFLTDAQAATTYVSPPPGSVVEGNLENSTEFFWFFEGQTTLASDLPVDITTSGVYTAPTSLSPGFIAGNTTVNSYLLHFDPVGTPTEVQSAFGTLSFPYPILGIIVSGSLLGDSDFLGPAGTTYPTDPTWRGLEFGTGSVADLIIYDSQFNGGLGAITPVLHASTTGVDQVRILTGVPAPTSLFLLGSGLIGLVSFRKRFRR